MTKKAKLALFSIPILVGVYLIYRQFRKSKGLPNRPIGDNAVTNVLQSVVSKKCDFPLSKGISNCDKVVDLQSLLNSFPQDFPNKPLAEDGDFGTKTEQALIAVFGKNSVASLSELSKLYTMQSNAVGGTQWVAPMETTQTEPNIFYGN